MAVAARRLTSGTLTCSPPDLRSLSTRIIEVETRAHVGREHVLADKLARYFLAEAYKFVIGSYAGDRPLAMHPFMLPPANKKAAAGGLYRLERWLRLFERKVENRGVAVVGVDRIAAVCGQPVRPRERRRKPGDVVRTLTLRGP